MSTAENTPGWSSTSDTEEENDWSATGWSSTSQDEHGWSSTDVEENGVLLLSDYEQVNTSDGTSFDYERVYARPLAARSLRNFIASEVSSGKVLKTKALSLLHIKSVLKDKCKCGKMCIQKMSVETIRQLRKSYWESSSPGRLQMLIFYIKHSTKLGKFRYINVTSKLNLCSYAFIRCLNISHNKLTRAFEAHEQNDQSTPGKNSRSVRDNSLILVAWIEAYAEMHGDRMPNTNQILLPYGLIKNDLYSKYKEECSTEPVSRAQFYNIWKQHFPHVKVKKTNTFTKCTTCTTLERQIAKTTCVETRALYRQQKEAHNRRQMMERKYYYGKREESRNSPDQYMSLIIDGMDQAKTNLPHFTGRKPKNMNGADLLKTHVTGVINHGHGGLHTFVDICQYSHDPNLTLNVLLKIFLSTSEKCGNKLPATLYLQADNCFRENKNKFVLAFCELLVRCEIFTEIHLSFLIVGHTHEDVDCAFSKISETLRKKDAETVEELLALLPETALLGDMLDVKGWLAPALQDVSGVSRPLHYKFKKVEQAVNTFYKGRHDQPWIQLSGDFLSFIPDGKPAKLAPDYSNIDCGVQMRQVENLQHMFQKPSTLNKWRQFYRSIEEGTFEKSTSSGESWVLDHLPRQRQREQFISVIPEVIQLLQRETEEPETAQMCQQILVCPGHIGRISCNKQAKGYQSDFEKEDKRLDMMQVLQRQQGQKQEVLKGRACTGHRWIDIAMCPSITLFVWRMALTEGMGFSSTSHIHGGQ